MSYPHRIVITGVGLTAPNGSSLSEFRENLLNGVSGVRNFETRYMDPTHAGVCEFDVQRHQKKKDARRGTRAGQVGIYASREALLDAGLDIEQLDRSRIGVYLGITEHGNVETENEIFNISQFGYDTKYWSHHHNPRTVANNPAGEVTLNMGINGPHYTIGAACAAGNAGVIQGAQMLILDDVDIALAGGVSESIHTFGIFASFKSQGALAFHEDPTKASRPFDLDRNGIVVSEGGCVYVLERLERAKARGARIYGEVVGHGINSDASDYVLPNPVQQKACIELAMKRAGLTPQDIDLVSTHATSTPLGDVQECKALREVFADAPQVSINNTKSFIGHSMGAAGALELAGNLPSFEDKTVHHTINVDNLDPQCALDQLVTGEPRQVDRVDTILNVSSGMLGINSVLIIKRYEG